MLSTRPSTTILVPLSLKPASILPSTRPKNAWPFLLVRFQSDGDQALRGNHIPGERTLHLGVPELEGGFEQALEAVLENHDLQLTGLVLRLWPAPSDSGQRRI